MRLHDCVIGFGTVVMACIPVFTNGQWSTTPDSNLQIGVGEAPQIVSDGEGGAFVVWDWFAEQVRLQKLDKYGYVQWTEITPQGGIDVGGTDADSCWETVEILKSSIVSDDSGGVYVAFLEVCVIGWYDGWPIEVTKFLLQHVDSEGNLLWGQGLEPSLREVYERGSPQLVTDGEGGVIVVFSSQDEQYGPRDIYAQRLDAEGNYLWGDEGVLVIESHGFSRAVSDGEGGVIIGRGYRMQRIDSNGNNIWEESGVYVPTGASWPVLSTSDNAVYTTGGEYLGNNQARYVVQKLSLIDGSLEWDSSGVTIDTLDIESGISDFTTDQQGNIWIAWYHHQGDDYLQYIQKLSQDGSAQFPLPGIPPSPFPSDKGGQHLQLSQHNTIIAVWTDYRNVDSDLYAQRISMEGHYLWANDVLVSTLGGTDLTSDENGGVILTWYDIPSFGIYLQQVSMNGILGEVILGTTSNPPLGLPYQLTLFQNYPNPFNSTTTITYYLTQHMGIKLLICNVLGEIVAVLVDENQEAGDHTVTFNASALSSGIYFYRLEGHNLNETRKMIYLR